MVRRSVGGVYGTYLVLKSRSQKGREVVLDRLPRSAKAQGSKEGYKEGRYDSINADEEGEER